MARIDYYGTDEVLKKLDTLGVNVENALADALLESAEKPKTEMLDYIRQHRRTGQTEESFIENIEIDRNNGKIYLEVGFNLKGKKPGLPALYLNYGTPFIQPSFFIDKAIENNIDEIKRVQQNSLNKVLKGVGLK